MRNCIFIGVSIAFVGLCNTASADDEKKVERKTPAHSKEWTDHNSSDPGVASTMDELARIVVLCATDHQSPEFKHAWRNYLNSHKPDRDETSRLIKEILAKAERRRQEAQREKPDRSRSASWKGEANKIMHDTSKSMIQNTRD